MTDKIKKSFATIERLHKGDRAAAHYETATSAQRRLIRARIAKILHDPADMKACKGVFARLETMNLNAHKKVQASQEDQNNLMRHDTQLIRFKQERMPCLPTADADAAVAHYRDDYLRLGYAFQQSLLQATAAEKIAFKESALISGARPLVEAACKHALRSETDGKRRTAILDVMTVFGENARDTAREISKLSLRLQTRFSQNRQQDEAAVSVSMASLATATMN